MAYDKVVDSAVLDAGIKSIADAVRAKTESTELLGFPGEIAAAINNISTKEDLNDVLTEQGELIDAINSVLIEQGVKTVQAKTVAPSLEEQTVTPDVGYLINEIKVEPITTELLVSLDSDLAPENINEGVEILGVTGTLLGRKPEQAKTVTPSLEEQNITPDEGHAISGVTVGAVDAELLASLDTDFKAENIAEGVNMFGVTGVFEGGGLKFDVVTASSLPAVVVENQIVVLTSTTPTNISVSTYAPAEPIENDIWVVIGESTYGVAQAVEGVNVTVTFTEVKQYNGMEWKVVTGVIGINGVFQRFSGQTLENSTWAEIAEISAGGIAPACYYIGETKAISINGVDYDIEIVDFNHDDLADGSGKAGITFALKNCLNTTYDNRNTVGPYNEYRWDESTLRATLRETIFGQLESGLQAVVKPVTKQTATDYQSDTMLSTTDTLFLFSEYEIFGTFEYSHGYVYGSIASTEGTRYALYATADTWVKYVGETASYCWLRSPRSGANRQACCISASGNASHNDYTKSLGVFFGFCV